MEEVAFVAKVFLPRMMRCCVGLWYVWVVASWLLEQTWLRTWHGCHGLIDDCKIRNCHERTVNSLAWTHGAVMTVATVITGDADLVCYSLFITRVDARHYGISEGPS